VRSIAAAIGISHLTLNRYLLAVRALCVWLSVKLVLGCSVKSTTHVRLFRDRFVTGIKVVSQRAVSFRLRIAFVAISDLCPLLIAVAQASTSAQALIRMLAWYQTVVFWLHSVLPTVARIFSIALSSLQQAYPSKSMQTRLTLHIL
jgi:hypothetical protein